MVPSVSAYPAAGSTTEAWATESVGKVSTAITVARCSARSASARSALSLIGSAPSRISTGSEPSAAAASIAAVDLPRPAGTLPTRR